MFMYTDYTQHLLDNVKKIHFIGCGGSGMYPLIQILSAKGYDISGSDVLDGSIIRSEREMGVKVTLGHSADNVVGADLVVYSAAIAKDNVELNAAASYGITTVERSVLLGYVRLELGDGLCKHGIFVTGSLQAAFHLVVVMFIGIKAGSDVGQVGTHFGTAVHIVAALVVEEAFLHIDGVEAGVDVSHQKHQGVVEGGGFLVFGSQVCDFHRVGIQLLCLIFVAAARTG